MSNRTHKVFSNVRKFIEPPHINLVIKMFNLFLENNVSNVCGILYFTRTSGNFVPCCNFTNGIHITDQSSYFRVTIN